MPNLIGLTEARGPRSRSARPASTVGEVDYEASETRRQGRGHRAGPRTATSTSTPATTVDIVVSTGKPMVAGAVRGRASPRTRRATSCATPSSSPKFKSEESDEPKGEVLAHRARRAARRVQQGSTVDGLRLRRPGEGPERGRPAAGRRPRRRSATPGSSPQVRDDPTSTEPAGTVTDQFPGGRKPQAQGSTVIIFVSVYVEPPPPPPTDTPADRDRRPTSSRPTG